MLDDNNGHDEPLDFEFDSLVIFENGSIDVLEDIIDNDYLTIYGKAIFNGKVTTKHCDISKKLCPNFEEMGKVYHIEGEIKFGEYLVFLSGFHCEDVNFV